MRLGQAPLWCGHNLLDLSPASKLVGSFEVLEVDEDVKLGDYGSVGRTAVPRGLVMGYCQPCLLKE